MQNLSSRIHQSRGTRNKYIAQRMRSLEEKQETKITMKERQGARKVREKMGKRPFFFVYAPSL